MTISDIAKASGFSTQTIRYYERMGLIQATRATNGYRTYSDKHLTQLLFIQRAKLLGLSLKEIAQLTALLREGDCACDQLFVVLPRKIEELEAQIEALVQLRNELRSYLNRLASRVPGAQPGCMSGPQDTTLTASKMKIRA